MAHFAAAGRFMAANQDKLKDTASAFTSANGSNPIAAMLEIDPYALIISIVTIAIMYKTRTYSYWIKVVVGLLMLLPSIYLIFVLPDPVTKTTFNPANLPFYLTLVYIYADYFELLGKGGGKKKKKKK